jgi:hypothetical protein
MAIDRVAFALRGFLGEVGLGLFLNGREFRVTRNLFQALRFIARNFASNQF